MKREPPDTFKGDRALALRANRGTVEQQSALDIGHDFEGQAAAREI